MKARDRGETVAVHVLAAPDKFRGSASASEIAGAIAAACASMGATCDEAPMADGGEGTLHALGGANRSSRVTGPLGAPVQARWRLAGREAVIEMSRASGLALVGTARDNDPLGATTTGTGELIAAAISSGARRVIVAAGGSATTDGGLGALGAMPSKARMRGVELIVACDVRTLFLDAAAVFGPQKGATPAQVELLRRRLERLAQMYESDHGVDVTVLLGAGAAGGLAGGLAARGARLVDGFEVVAEQVSLWDRLVGADLVITGEGRLDATSLQGKVVGGVASLAAEAGVAALAVVGSLSASVPLPAGLDVIDLSAHFGEQQALDGVADCVRMAVSEELARRA